jgi:O-antigen/teichoic acid export membrane protein
MGARRFLLLVLKGAGWFFAARVGSAISLLLINAMLARLLSLQEFAAYVLFLSIVTIAGTFAGVGLGTACTRTIAEARTLGRTDVMRRAALAGFLLSLGVAILIALLAFVWPVPLLLERVLGRPLSGLESLCLVVWLVCFAVRNTGGFVYRGMQLLALAALFQGTVANILGVALLALAWAAGWSGLTVTLVVMAAAAVLPFLICWLDIARRLEALPAPSEPSVFPLRDFLRIGGFMSLPTLFQTNGREVCVWIVSATAALPEVALFGAANRLMQVIALPVVVTNQVLQPFIAEFRAAGSLEQRARALRLSTAIVFVVMAGLVVGIGLFGDVLLAIIFRPEFAAAQTILLWLALGRLVQAFFGPSFAVLSMTGHERLLARDAALQFLCLALLGSLGGWLMGAVGVAVAFCLTLASFAVYRTFTVQRRLKIWLLPELDPQAMLAIARQALRRRGRKPAAGGAVANPDAEGAA